jgi:hypothetical protein
MERRTGSRPNPRISAPKLEEYLEASASRRERILRDQKFPRTDVVVRYEKARQAIRAALVSGNAPTRLKELARAIEQMPAKSSYDSDSARLSAEAVRRFATLHDRLALKDTRALLPSAPKFSLVSEGVSISIAPAVLLRRTKRDGMEYCGALTVVLRKDEPLGLQGGKAVAELARLALANAGYKNIRPDLCVAVDVFGGRIFTAAGRGQRIAGEIASACREIAVRWPALTSTNAA